MQDIPIEIIEPLKELLEWHLKEYPKTQLPEAEGYIRLDRLLEEMYHNRNKVPQNTVWFLKEAVYDASTSTNNIGISKEELSAIQEWTETLHK